ncbi:hypothetical protein H4R18_005459 [Coemansia javaensis]|uniref:alpha-1,2-Mannosidase n=1 Tax=Coemansia javaensis TaxID=2761396 RepID=A0A9W8H503_9FUNG|nr:hypothetical protein H4R18_005459 [Coemansia javaensis]
MILLRRATPRGLALVAAAALGGLYVLHLFGGLWDPELGLLPGIVRSGSRREGWRHASAQNATGQQRLAAVRGAMAHAWKGYRDYAFGQDELQPLTRSGNVRWGNWSISLVDALDTLWLMDMKDEYAEAKAYVQKIDFTRSPRGYRVRVFEMTIRALGGLLGAYELDHDPALLAKAAEVGSTLAAAFSSPTGLPYPSIDLNSRRYRSTTRLCIAEGGTLQLEFKKLAQLTGNKTYADLADRAYEALEAAERPIRGLYPTFIDVNTGKYDLGSEYSLGGGADSFYEYQLKQHILHNHKRPQYGAQYAAAVEAVKAHLVRKNRDGLTFVGSIGRHGGAYAHRMGHLACFYPGLLALGAQAMGRAQDLPLAKELARTCYLTYKHSPTGLGPEGFVFYDRDPADDSSRAPDGSDGEQRVASLDDLGITVTDANYILRPETLESLFVLHRVTGDPVYREWGWDIFQAIESHARVEHGYAAYRDIRSPASRGNLDNSMESFFLAETLKYLYLLFAPPDVLPLDRFVLTTEAHPLRIMPN